MLISKTGFMFTAAEWRALLSAASTDDARINLHGLYLDPAHGSAVTTDGHRMMVASVEPGPDSPTWAVVLPRVACDAVAKAAGSRGAIVVTADDAKGEAFTLFAVKDRTVIPMIEPEIRAGGPMPIDAPAIMDGVATFRTRRANVTFPPWRQVIRSSNPAPVMSTAIAVNPRYLAEAAAALAAVMTDGKTQTAITIWPATGMGLDPLMIGAVRDGVIWRSIVMPMKAEAAGVGGFAPVALPSGAPAWDVTAARQAGAPPEAPAKPTGTGAAVIPMGGRKSRSRAG